MKPIVLFSVASLAACASTRKSAELAPPVETKVSRVASESTDASREIDTLSERAFGPIFFAFDSDALLSEAKQVLDGLGEHVQRGRAASLTVVGHADERGTSEYNIALGERRANAIRNYLVWRGVSRERIATISYGEERPLVAGSDEAAMAKNRRGEIELARSE